MILRKLFNFANIGDINKIALSLELSNQSNNIIKTIMKAKTFPIRILARN